MSTGWGSPKRRVRGEQLAFADRPCRNGEARKRAGRKPSARPGVRHRVRPRHSKWVPLHITLRAVAGLPSFRCQLLFAAFERAIRLTRRADFRIVEFSLQSNHAHLIVEAESNDALTRGMKSFTVRANRLLNAAFGRKRGKLWAGRYHREDLTTPRQVRNAIVYCLMNFKKHEPLAPSAAPTIDYCSSARWFTGWNARRKSDDGPRPTPLATIPLLTCLWQKGRGLVDPREAPKSRR